MMPALLWCRRDLRLSDHPALAAAAGAGGGSEGGDVLACFVLDPRLEASAGRRRLQFLGDSLRRLRDDPEGRLLVTRGLPEERIPLIAKEIGASSVHISEDFGRVCAHLGPVARRLFALDIGEDRTFAGAPTASDWSGMTPRTTACDHQRQRKF
jgi:deoxyribodipyrimidine photolyase